MINLDKGLLLEDLDILLEWGRPVDKSISIRKEEKGDRTIYDWGRHKILNGLELQLTQTFMYGDKVPRDKFTFIQYKEVGDKLAIESFRNISEHLITELGQPEGKDESQTPDKFWTWKQGKGKIELYLFEQHAFKSHLTIKTEKV